MKRQALCLLAALLLTACAARPRVPVAGGGLTVCPEAMPRNGGQCGQP